ncbi:hypothetical protein CYMTET_33284 [Cymbomonas tetramitiformis]|uniref:Uncharacterized protein n=1 Tax=Cymbomonas tetramitiformis TaxID=36881 RepID=A0AAE0KR39_9CHLO|nr:hypothetical protein CYMTET_33284 [Cymbomonas tetramitiformis]
MIAHEVSRSKSTPDNITRPATNSSHLTRVTGPSHLTRTTDPERSIDAAPLEYASELNMLSSVESTNIAFSKSTKVFSLDRLPVYAPLRFSFDISGTKFGAAKGRNKAPSLRDMKKTIRKEWIHQRMRQERSFMSGHVASYFPHALAEALLALHHKIVAGDRDLLRSRLFQVKDSGHIVALEYKLGEELTDSKLAKLGVKNMLLLRLILDLSNDPLIQLLQSLPEIHDFQEFQNATHFSLPIFVYPMALSNPKDTETAYTPTRELRIARINAFDICLELRALPWPTCTLRPPRQLVVFSLG